MIFHRRPDITPFLDAIVEGEHESAIIMADYIEDKYKDFNGDNVAELVRLTWQLQYEPEHKDFAERQQRLQWLLSVGTQPVRPTREYKLKGYAETFNFVWIPSVRPLDGSCWLAETVLTRNQMSLLFAVSQKRMTSIPLLPLGLEAASFNVLYFAEQLTSIIRPGFEQLAVNGSYIRLPSHREWVMACRAGTTSDFPFDRSDASIFCTYGRHVERFYNTETVGNLRPNAWGLYGMCGGIEELVFDRHGNILACGGHAYAPLDHCTSESNRLVFSGDNSPMSFGIRLCFPEEYIAE